MSANVIAWCLRHLLVGTWPSSRHDGEPWREGERARSKRVRAVLVEVGDWKLDVEARGWGENTIGAFQDNFIIVITVHRVCQQYPIEPPCDE